MRKNLKKSFSSSKNPFSLLCKFLILFFIVRRRPRNLQQCLSQRMSLMRLIERGIFYPTKWRKFVFDPFSLIEKLRWNLIRILCDSNWWSESKIYRKTFHASKIKAKIWSRWSASVRKRQKQTDKSRWRFAKHDFSIIICYFSIFRAFVSSQRAAMS